MVYFLNIAGAKIRVLHVISSLDSTVGGPAVAVAGFARAQRLQGIDVSVASTWIEGEKLELATDMQAHGISVHLMGPCTPRIRWHSSIAPTLRSLIPQFDIVHIHALWEEIQHRAAVCAYRFGKPYVLRTCGMLDPWSLKQGWLKKQIYMMLRLRKDLQRASAIHFTAETERRLTESLKLRAPAIVEPNGIAMDEFRQLPERGIFRAKHPAIGSRRMILFLSRLHHKKGVHLLLPAFAKAAAQTDAVLVLVGPDTGPYTGEMQQLAKDLGISDRVIFAGMLRGAQRLEALCDADFFVLPSFQENFGIAVVEAMAAGQGVIISDQVNICTEIDAAGAGIVVKLEIDAIAQAISTWLANPQAAQRAGEIGREFALRTYDWSKIAARWASHYESLCRGTVSQAHTADAVTR